MADLNRFKSLTPAEQLMVTMGVLLDGHDSVEFLLSAKKGGAILSKAASDLLTMPIDLRLSLCGTLLRQAIEKINKSDHE